MKIYCQELCDYYESKVLLQSYAYDYEFVCK